MSIKNTARRRTIDSFAAHGLTGPKRTNADFPDSLFSCIAKTGKVKLSDIKNARKARNA